MRSFQAHCVNRGAICCGTKFHGAGPLEKKAFLKRLLRGKIVLLYFFLKVAAAAAAKSLQSCSTVRPHKRQPTSLPRPWDSPGKSTGVGCHFLLQCMKVKSESEVAQSCPTLSEPMDCSPPGCSLHGIFQARVLPYRSFVVEHETNRLCLCRLRACFTLSGDVCKLILLVQAVL